MLPWQDLGRFTMLPLDQTAGNPNYRSTGSYSFCRALVLATGIFLI